MRWHRGDAEQHCSHHGCMAQRAASKSGLSHMTICCTLLCQLLHGQAPGHAGTTGQPLLLCGGTGTLLLHAAVPSPSLATTPAVAAAAAAAAAHTCTVESRRAWPLLTAPATIRDTSTTDVACAACAWCCGTYCNTIAVGNLNTGQVGCPTCPIPGGKNGVVYCCIAARAACFTCRL